jgi:hypothetical protein
VTVANEPHVARRGRLSWLVLAGVASPMFLTIATVVVAAGRPDYLHVRQTPSELGAVGRAGAVWMNRLGIVPAGALVLACARPSTDALVRAGVRSLARSY